MQRDLLSWRVCSENRRGANVCSMRPTFSRTPSCYQPHSHRNTRTCFVAYLILIVHPGGDPISPETRRKPQTCRAHGEVGNQIKGQGPELYGHCDEGEELGLQLDHADGPSANMNNRQSQSLTWGKRPGPGRGMRAWSGCRGRD